MLNINRTEDDNPIRVWTKQMIYGTNIPLPQIKQVAISSFNLIFVLDSIGRITIINKDLNNGEHGIIFTLKKAYDTQKFFFPELDVPYQFHEPENSVQLFKR